MKQQHSGERSPWCQGPGGAHTRVVSGSSSKHAVSLSRRETRVLWDKLTAPEPDLKQSCCLVSADELKYRPGRSHHVHLLGTRCLLHC